MPPPKSRMALISTYVPRISRTYHPGYYWLKVLIFALGTRTSLFPLILHPANTKSFCSVIQEIRARPSRSCQLRLIVDQALQLERTIQLIWAFDWTTYYYLSGTLSFFFMDNNPILSGRLTSLHEHGITDNDILVIISTKCMFLRILLRLLCFVQFQKSLEHLCPSIDHISLIYCTDRINDKWMLVSKFPCYWLFRFYLFNFSQMPSTTFYGRNLLVENIVHRRTIWI